MLLSFQSFKRKGGVVRGVYILALEEKVFITFEKENILEWSLDLFYEIYLLVISPSFIWLWCFHLF